MFSFSVQLDLEVVLQWGPGHWCLHLTVNKAGLPCPVVHSRSVQWKSNLLSYRLGMESLLLAGFLGKILNLSAIYKLMIPPISENCCETHAKLHTKCLGTVNIFEMLGLLPSGWEEVAMMSHSSEYVLTFASFFHFNPRLLANLITCLQDIEEVDRSCWRVLKGGLMYWQHFPTNLCLPSVCFLCVVMRLLFS